VRFAGAAYLVWLGLKTDPRAVVGVDVDAPRSAARRIFPAGFWCCSPPQSAGVLRRVFIPQFMDMSRDHFSQVALLGSTFMVTGAITDSDLRAVGGARAPVLLGAADAAVVAHSGAS